MTKKTIFEWAEIFQNDIQEGASQSDIIQLLENYKTEQLILHPVIETNPIGEDYVILNEATYRDKQECERTACYEYVDGKQIYYTHKDNIYSR